MTILLHLLVMLGMLVVVPLGLRLIGDLPRWLPTVWLAGAVAGSLTLWLPRGSVAAVLAAGYAAATWLLAAQAPARWWRRRRLDPGEIAVLTALVTPAVAGTALVAERFGHRLFGFDLPILALTVAHFLYAGFVAALVAALVTAASRHRTAAALAACCVPAGIAVVFVGFFTGRLIELAGAVILTAGMWLVAWLLWSDARRATTDRRTRALFGVAATVLVGTMLLALNWAVGRAVGLPYLPLEWMVATHGVANAVGFGLCAILAWRRLQGGPGWTTTPTRATPTARSGRPETAAGRPATGT